MIFYTILFHMEGLLNLGNNTGFATQISDLLYNSKVKSVSKG